jgi:hypothetical protein
LENTKPRRLTLVDAMILVAATGIGLAVIRTWSPEYYTEQHTPIPPATWLEWSSFVVSAWAFYLAPIPAAWSLAVLILRALHPRPPLRAAFAHAGSAAALGSAVAIASGVTYFLLDLRNPSWHDLPFEYTTYSAGIAVAAVWVVLASAGTWRPHRDWVDVLGRALGVYWILMVPVVLLRSFSR